MFWQERHERVEKFEKVLEAEDEDGLPGSWELFTRSCFWQRRLDAFLQCVGTFSALNRWMDYVSASYILLDDLHSDKKFGIDFLMKLITYYWIKITEF